MFKRFKGLLKIQIITCLIILSSTPPILAEQNTKSWGYDSTSSGGSTASTSNLQLTVPFNPTGVAVCNDSATIKIFVDLTDGVAAATNNSTNISIAPLECHTWKFAAKNASNTFLIGIITGSSTANIRAEAIRDPQ